MNSLKDSRWAPSSLRGRERRFADPILNPPATVSSTLNARSKSESPVRKQNRASHTLLDQIEDFSKFSNYLRRLKWRSSTLLYCHSRALRGETDNWIFNTNFPVTTEDAQANAADTMFKLDFFEYYVLLERVLVHLLGACGTIINAEHGTYIPLPPKMMNGHGSNTTTQQQQDINSSSILGDAKVIHRYAHRFHANVLLALDQQTHPLHHILGVGQVRQYLGLAKEVRNKWKEADLQQQQQNRQNSRNTGGQGETDDDDLTEVRRRYHEILQDLKLDEMLATILFTLDQASNFVRGALERARVQQQQLEMQGQASLNLEMKRRSVALDDSDDAMIIDDDVM